MYVRVEWYRRTLEYVEYGHQSPHAVLAVAEHYSTTWILGQEVVKIPVLLF